MAMAATNRLRKHLPTTLSVLASAGVVCTAITAVKATPMALKLIEEDKKLKNPSNYTKKDAFLSCWKCYIPSVMIGASTILCVFGANGLNQRQQTSLASSYVLLSKSYDQYKNKVKELFGEDVHDQVVSAIVKEQCKDVHLYAPTIAGECSLDLDNDINPEDLYTFYDRFSDRYFETTVARVLQAEYHLNRNFTLGGTVTLNDFYEFLGVEGIEIGDLFGWTMSDGYMWIDFDHTIANIDDGTPLGAEVYIIDMMFSPCPLESI